MAHKKQLSVENTIVRSFKRGDEALIVDLLNLCFGKWGTLEKWRTSYLQYPNFENDHVVILERNNNIIGHGGLHFRGLMIPQGHEVSTVSLNDAAINPRYRGLGLYTELVDARLQTANSKGACLAFTWHLKGSNAYKHNKKIGFVEIKQTPAYIKIIKPEKMLKAGVIDFIHKNERLRTVLHDLGTDLHFQIGNAKFSVNEIIHHNTKRRDGEPKKKRRRIDITVDESALPFLANFRSMSKLERFQSLVSLLLLGRVKLRFNSFWALLKLGSRGLTVVGTI